MKLVILTMDLARIIARLSVSEGTSDPQRAILDSLTDAIEVERVPGFAQLVVGQEIITRKAEETAER